MICLSHRFNEILTTEKQFNIHLTLFEGKNFNWYNHYIVFIYHLLMKFYRIFLIREDLLPIVVRQRQTRIFSIEGRITINGNSSSCLRERNNSVRNAELNSYFTARQTPLPKILCRQHVTKLMLNFADIGTSERKREQHITYSKCDSKHERIERETHMYVYAFMCCTYICTVSFLRIKSPPRVSTFVLPFARTNLCHYLYVCN